MTKKLSLLITIAIFVFTIPVLSQENNLKDISPVLSSHPEPVYPVDLPLWDVQFDYNAQTVTGANGNAGAIFIPTLNEFWTSRWASNLNHRWTDAGALIEQFSIPGVTGVRAFTFDGTHIYVGLNTNTIHKIDPVTKTSVGTITAPQTVRYITFVPTADGGNGGFWIGNFSTNPQLISMTGALLQTLTYAGLGVTSIYGAAWDAYLQNGPYLWFWGQGGGAATPQRIVQVNPTTGLPTGVEHDVKTDIGLGNATSIAGGLFIAEGIVPGFVTIGGMLQGVPDKLFGYELTAVTNIENNQIPVAYSLSQNFPNPFNPVTKINYSVLLESDVTMKVFDIRGQEVATLVNTSQKPGQYSVDFNAEGLSTGLYFYRLEAKDFIDTKKMLLIK